MVLVNGRLVAILVHLSEQYEDPELRGRWFVEAGFGPLFGKHEIFSTPEEAEAWIRQHFGTLKDHGAKNGTAPVDRLGLRAQSRVSSREATMLVDRAVHVGEELFPGADQMREPGTPDLETEIARLHALNRSEAELARAIACMVDQPETATHPQERRIVPRRPCGQGRKTSHVHRQRRHVPARPITPVRHG